MSASFRFHGPTSGLTVRARLFLDDATAPSTINCPEIGGSTGAGVYVGTFTTQPAGVYGVRFFDNGVAGAAGLLGSGTIEWDGTNIIERATIISEIDANEAKIDTALTTVAANLTAIGENQTDLNAALATLTQIDGFTDTLEAGQTAMTTLLNAIQDYVDTLEPSVANLPTANAIVAALMAETIEPGATFIESIRLQNAAVNDTTGMETGTGVLKSVDGTKDRVTVALDQVTGNRAISTRDLS